MAYTLESCFKIWDDDEGARYEISPDSDGLNFIEFRYVTNEDKIVERITFPPVAGKLIHEALGKLLEALEGTNAADGDGYV